MCGWLVNAVLRPVATCRATRVAAEGRGDLGTVCWSATTTLFRRHAVVAVDDDGGGGGGGGGGLGICGERWFERG